MSGAETAPMRATSSLDASPSYWALAWRQLRRNRPGMAGLALIGLLVATALFAPVLANDRPVVARLDGHWRFPAMTTYVDSWVPWRSLRYGMKSLKVGSSPGWFPFNDFYPELKGDTWKAARAQGRLSSDLWPPVQWHPNQFSASEIKLRPSRASGHLLGTDDQGRDVLSRLIHGSVVAVTVGMVSMAIAAALGVSLGLAAGYLGGWTDLVLSRITEIVITFPVFFLIIAIIAFLEPSMVNIMLVLGFVGWTGIFRLIRGEVLKVRSLDYVLAAEALGGTRRQIMLRHVLPNAVPPVFVAVAFGIAGAVLTETTLSFLGFGDQAVPSWGEIVSEGRIYSAQGLWHLALFPGLAIFLTLTAFNLLGQGLRDALDPKLRR